MRLLFPGSFDPPHLGHLDVIQRAAAVAHGGGGELIVAIAEHPEKTGWLPVTRRVELVTALCIDIPGTRVVSYRGATVRFAQQHGITTLVRGLRNPLDFEHEKSMAEVNRSHGFDTVFFMTAGAHAHLSSNLVRAAQAAGLPVAGLVPPLVANGLTSSS